MMSATMLWWFLGVAAYCGVVLFGWALCRAAAIGDRQMGRKE